MPKLFVALDLPLEARTKCVGLQPASAPGIRLTEPGQMHLTLHFLGEADIDRSVAVLAKVVAAPFNLSFQGVGRFPSAGGTTTLWAGVRATPELHQIHAAVAAALSAEGYRQEARPYNPHLTLARCEPGFSEQVIENFLRMHEGFSLPEVPIVTFGLFSSTSVAGVPVYRCERAFSLRSAAP